MGAYLRKNTTTTVLFGPLVAASDGYSYLATTITLSASHIVVWKTNGTVTELSTGAGTVPMPRPGWLLLTVAASDVTVGGRMRYSMGNVAASGNNLPVFREFTVLPENKYDAMTVSTYSPEVDTIQINGQAPSDAIPAGVLNYVMFTPGVQSITVKDTLKVMAAALAGKLNGATGAAVRLYDPAGTLRVSAGVVSGNRQSVTWVTG